MCPSDLALMVSDVSIPHIRLVNFEFAGLDGSNVVWYQSVTMINYSYVMRSPMPRTHPAMRFVFRHDFLGIWMADLLVLEGDKS